MFQFKKNTVGAIQKHCGSDLKTLWERESAPSVSWKVKHETKNETWKINQRFWKRIEILCDKQQFIGLIGGRVFNPRQQQALSIYL